jgi:glycosyltransferase involved in cell wall biosynthesis
MPRKTRRSIALVNPLGDYGINTYCFELAEGLASNGIDVDVYTGSSSPLSELPQHRHHRCYPVLGSPLFKQRRTLSGTSRSALPRPPADPSPQPAESLKPKSDRRGQDSLRAKLRKKFLELELIGYLKRRHYDLVWTQWPDVYGASFWKNCSRLGIKTVHTVHNVLPHEESPEQVQLLRRVYRYSRALVVHSEASRNDLVRIFPESLEKVLVAPHGMYTVYPRIPEARSEVRKRLGIPSGALACLLCGGIRPYKNVDAVLGALANGLDSRVVLVIAGQESGYQNASASDPLARTRALAKEFGVLERVRLVPRFLTATELAEFFEACDVLVLPYLKNYGSGLLLLGMTFGKYILATDTGGAGEYLAGYPRHILLEGAETAQVAAGLTRVAGLPQDDLDKVLYPEIPRLDWNAITRDLLPELLDSPFPGE